MLNIDRPIIQTLYRLLSPCKNKMGRTVGQNVYQTVGDTIDKIKWLTMQCDRILLLSFERFWPIICRGSIFHSIIFTRC